MFYNSPYRSPYQGMSRTTASRNMPSSTMGYTMSGQKSPLTHDRYMFKSPNRMNGMPDNFKDDFDCYNCNGINAPGTPGTPGTPKTSKYLPAATKITLDAPDIKTDPPVKLIDMNERNELVIALDTNVYIWKDRQCHCLMEGEVPIDGVCWVGDNVAISGVGHVELWDVSQQEAIQEFYDHDNRAAALAAYGDNSFATGGQDGIVCMFDLRTNRNNRKFTGHHGQVNVLSWSPDGNSLASGGDDANVCIFDSRKKPGMMIKHEAPVQALTWMKPGMLVTGQGGAGILKSFNMHTNACKEVHTGAPISGVCMTEKWGLLISHCDESGMWAIWSHDLNRRIGDYRFHKDQIINICSNSDGSFVATISADESLMLCELSQAPLTPIQQSRGLSSQAKSPRSNVYGAPKSPGAYQTNLFGRSASPFSGLR